ncbi:MAG: Omp28-related outer membrane protein [Bacteroidales bacterium]|nr:Omp28-related outer membrane protein [Bacteroidales bacterium]
MLKKLRLQYLLIVAPLILTGCPGKVNPVTEPSLSISLSDPFKSAGNGNWGGDVTSEGATATITVKSSDAWTASSDASWCIVSPVRGNSSDSKITLVVNANESPDGRTATVSVKSGELSHSVEVRQTGKTIIPFSVTPTEVELPATGGTFSVTVTCPTTFKISSIPAWIQNVSKSATGPELSFKAEANAEFQERSDVIVICDDIGVCLPVRVSQKAREGTAFEMDWSKDFYHRSLFLRFTGTWCGYCPNMASAQKRVSDSFPDKLVCVALHDNASKLKFSGTAALVGQYKVSSFPRGIVDGRCAISNSGLDATANAIENAFKQSQSSLPTVTATGLSSELSGNNLSVYADVFIKKAGSYKLTVFLLEDGIVAEQANNYKGGTETDYVHDCVARMALSSPTGDELSASTDRCHLLKHYSVSIPASYKKENMTLVAFVQRAYDGNVSKIAASDFDGYFVDNCTYSPLGISVPPSLVNGADGGNEGFDSGKPVKW